MERKYWIGFSLDLFEKALKEGLMKNSAILKAWWQWLISNKLLFYCNLEEFKDAMLSNFNIIELRAMLFTAYRLNFPNILDCVRFENALFLCNRFKITRKEIFGVKCTIYNNTTTTIKNRYELALEKEKELLEVFNLMQNKEVTNELVILQNELENKYYKQVFSIHKVDNVSGYNPFKTGDKNEFDIIIEYYLNLPKILHKEKYWLAFERQYMNILVKHLEEKRDFLDLEVRVGGILEKIEDGCIESSDEESIEESREILDELMEDEDYIDIHYYNDLLELAIKNKKEADKLIKDFFE